MTGLDEVDAIKAVAVALEKLDAEARDRVLGWANAKYGTVSLTTVTPKKDKDSSARNTDNRENTGGAKVSRSTKRSKSIIKIDKTLNLSPSGKQSAEDFVKEKSPTNVKQKSVVAAYYVREVLEQEKITVEQIAAIFKGVGWPLPADLKNILQQAGTEGWLDTADSQDIQITSSGETLVEHKLPKKTANN